MSSFVGKTFDKAESVGVIEKIPKANEAAPQPQQAARKGYRSVSGRRASFMSRRRANLLGAGTDLEGMS